MARKKKLSTKTTKTTKTAKMVKNAGAATKAKSGALRGRRALSEMRLKDLDRSLPADLTLEKLKRHTEEATTFKGIITESPDRPIARPTPARMAAWKRKYPPNIRHFFQAQRFGELVTEKLDGRMTGYCVGVRKDGATVYSRAFGNAQTEADRQCRWNISTRMHIASCSKFITAIALVKVLVEKNIGYDDTVWQYLPAYWSIHDDMEHGGGDGLTFRHLLTHRSGISTCGSSAPTDFLLMKKTMATCVPFKGNPHYCNLNFALMRVLIAVLSGGVDRNLLQEMPNLITQAGPWGLPQINPDYQKWLNRDTIWDLLATERYRTYVLEHVFKPAGVRFALFDSDLSSVPGYPAGQINNKAFAYRHASDSGQGWNSGNLRNGAGGVSWRLSVKELLDVLGAVRRSGRIISVATASEMCRQSFGIYPVLTARGEGYVHNGWWQDGNKRVEQAVQFILPDDIEIVALGNSSLNFDIAGDNVGHSFQGEILDAYNDSFAR